MLEVKDQCSLLTFLQSQNGNMLQRKKKSNSYRYKCIYIKHYFRVYKSCKLYLMGYLTLLKDAFLKEYQSSIKYLGTSSLELLIHFHISRDGCSSKIPITCSANHNLVNGTQVLLNNVRVAFYFSLRCSSVQFMCDYLFLLLLLL